VTSSPSQRGPHAGVVVQVAQRARLANCAALLIRAARAACAAVEFRRGELSIAVVGDRTMARLHLQHCGIRGSTDVLTFDLGSLPKRGTVEGEIVVCAAEARRRVGVAAPRRVSRELALYVVHGVLHLSGMDDHTAAGFRRMHALEDRILSGLGLGRVFAELNAER
jgi:probable rRNA maturation factor